MRTPDRGEGKCLRQKLKLLRCCGKPKLGRGAGCSCPTRASPPQEEGHRSDEESGKRGRQAGGLL